jgi:hypothetical protein
VAGIVVVAVVAFFIIRCAVTSATDNPKSFPSDGPASILEAPTDSDAAAASYSGGDTYSMSTQPPSQVNANVLTEEDIETVATPPAATAPNAAVTTPIANATNHNVSYKDQTQSVAHAETVLGVPLSDAIPMAVAMDVSVVSPV